MKVFQHLDFLALDPKAVDAFADALPTALPAGWSYSDTMKDGMLGKNTRAVRLIRERTAGVPRALLALVVQPGKATVGNIVPADDDDPADRELGHDRYNFILEEFATFALPLADAHHVQHTLTKAHADLGAWLSPQGITLLESFSNLANKSTGSGHPLDAERWYTFIIQTHREGSSLDVSTLGRYLVERLGWGDDQAHKLMLEYEFARELLVAYDRDRDRR